MENANMVKKTKKDYIIIFENRMILYHRVYYVLEKNIQSSIL